MSMGNRLRDQKYDLDDTKMSFFSHLIELRVRLIYAMAAFLACFFVGYYLAEPIFWFLVEPLRQLWNGQSDRQLIYTGLHEAFFTYIKVGFFFASCFSFPLVSMQVWLFITPGLYKSERHALLPFMVATPLMFLLGGGIVYYFVIPIAWKFFVSFEIVGSHSHLAMMLEPKVDQYLSLVMRLIFAFGVAFELPILLILLAKYDIVNSRILKDKRKYFIVLAFVVAAIMTPPDVVSQVLLAVPIILLYEFSIFIAQFIENKRKENAKTAGCSGLMS
ncbi:twin arginine-targeting protein translocase TatC [Candidatus Endolissoclinum faulkneri L2]|uniref:Sec-independent protein translocase protein TatC n=1 Tax=Candidatus Endolissoclinum faulkneri L2 TaxID=1193729 RepID=K7ZD42_9PROT|nr:twin-arginine translocase subunit TatC [Candidatus Endolissoclinum faulkneri]AFX99166.1 twin arginine-targeting protein translocase TatC [Candidatus Endolissoclinum faulkneri L2]